MSVIHLTSAVKLPPAKFLTLSFALLIAVGSILLWMPWSSASRTTSYIDALFTATSAVCVTGLITLNTATHWSFVGKAIILLLIQAGGLGVMTVATLFAFVMGKRIGLKQRILIQEALGQLTLSGVVRLTRHILLVTAIIEGFGAFLLTLRFLAQMPPLQALWYGVFHAVSAFCNAGFDIFGDSLVRFVTDPLVNFVVTGLIITGGIGFTVIAELYQYFTSKERLSLHSKLVLKVTVFLILSGTILVWLLERTNQDTIAGLGIPGQLLASYFQSVTARTAGFNTIDISAIRPATALILICLMFIGASPGGTGGGIKTSTAAVIVAAVYAMAAGKSEVEISERRIPTGIVLKAMGIATISACLVTSVAIGLSVFQRAQTLPIVFETVSAFGTVGLSMGITSELTALGKLLIILTMFAGRVGPLTLAMAIVADTNHTTVKHPEEKVIVG
ncbi:MAG TPA: Trk family potassium uptake protein [Firmicutes bacterium]|nr:Trk family potassium uptake protein [Bacillota bacterium]